jgi:hypothetical protein
MFAYFTKIINKDNIVSLYFNEDDYNDDEYLFNTQTIANWTNEYNVKFYLIPSDEIIVKSNDNIIPLFSYS